MQGDQVLGVPNAWQTGISVLRAGSYQVGISQLLQGCSGAMILPVPITEKVHVPTIEVIKGALGACSRLEENIEQWDDMVGFAAIDEMAEILRVQGRTKFQNILDNIDGAGLTIEDPLQMLMFIKNRYQHTQRTSSGACDGGSG